MSVVHVHDAHIGEDDERSFVECDSGGHLMRAHHNTQQLQACLICVPGCLPLHVHTRRQGGTFPPFLWLWPAEHVPSLRWCPAFELHPQQLMSCMV